MKPSTVDSRQGDLLRGVKLDSESASGMVEVELPFEDRAGALRDSGRRIDSSSDQIADPDEEAKEGAPLRSGQTYRPRGG